MTPGLLGISHLAFSVPDMAAAARFWVDVLGFEPLTSGPDLHFLIHRAARMAVVVTDHGGTVAGGFDEHHTGLDHLALVVPDPDALEHWRVRLDRHGVPHSGVVATDAGWHLNLRGPDGFPIELYAMADAFATSLGLDPAEPVAAGHH